MGTMVSESVDLTVTSPPYDYLRSYNGNNDEWNETTWKNVLSELWRVTKVGGVVVWVVGDATAHGSESGTSFKQALYATELGFNIHDTMIYLKDNPVPVGGHNRYYQSFEYMFVFSKGTPKTFNPIMVKRRNKWGDKRTSRVRGVTRDKDGNFTPRVVKVNETVKKSNVWKYVVSGGSTSEDKEAHKHPAIFPEQLAEDHILSWSNQGDVVFDPFLGSGTTGKMAIQHGRSFVGVELDKSYFSIAEQRIERYAKIRTLF